MSASNYAEDEINDHFLGTTANTHAATVYLQLHTADPTDTGTVGVSTITGSPSARVAINFGASTGGVATQSGTVSWTNAAGAGLPETITHWSIWDATSAGNCHFTGAMDVGKSVAAGDDIDVSGITVTVT